MSLLSLVFPRICVLCNLPLEWYEPDETPVCRGCSTAITGPAGDRCPCCSIPLVSEIGMCTRCRVRGYAFDENYSLYLYSGDVRELISVYKFEKERSLSRWFAGRLAETCAERFPGRTVVPVPFRPESKRKRGWDQIEEITRHLSREADIPTSSILERRHGPSQKTLDYQARLSNLKGRIVLKKRAEVPERVLLLDDVFTTGATLHECAEVLKETGAARNVSALTIALDA